MYEKYFKRIFDIILAIFGILILSPVFLICAILIKLEDKGTVLFIQKRVGKNGKLFKIFKFRTMKMNSENKGQLTLSNDDRITKVGNILRKTKIDEIPQLFNVLLGDMSFVGPRPEVPKYVELYNNNQRQILKMKPGITDYASIEFSNESDLLCKEKDYEKYYIEVIMPKKISLNKKYINNCSLAEDLKLIFLTLKKILCSCIYISFKEVKNWKK